MSELSEVQPEAPPGWRWIELGLTIEPLDMQVVKERLAEFKPFYLQHQPSQDMGTRWGFRVWLDPKKYGSVPGERIIGRVATLIGIPIGADVAWNDSNDFKT